jgi:mono/diheme cytochrome c family protein
MPGILAGRVFATALYGPVNSPLVARAVLIVFAVLLLAGCGGEKTVAPTGPVEGTLPKAIKGDAKAGKKVFLNTGCGSCHTFSAAGTSGTTGPNLDQVLKGKSADFIKKSIVDPNAEIAPGYKPDIMPPSYGSQLTPKQLADLVAFLQKG